MGKQRDALPICFPTTEGTGRHALGTSGLALLKSIHGTGARFEPEVPRRIPQVCRPRRVRAQRGVQMEHLQGLNSASLLLVLLLLSTCPRRLRPPNTLRPWLLFLPWCPVV